MIIGTLLNLSSTNPLLANGEIAYEIDRDLFKIGDGKQNYNSIGYDIPTDQFKNEVHFLFEGLKLSVQGEKGKDGTDGKNGADGKDGLDGKNGTDGIDGKNGSDGKDGKNGKDGLIGKDGEQGNMGLDGKNGKDGIDGADGKNGTDGKDGKDGTDGKSIKGDKGEPGKDGTQWFTGRTEPVETLGKDGDIYFNLTNANLYQKISGKWMLLSTLVHHHYGGGGSSSSPVAGGVTSFNTRVGAVTLLSADVTTALGFTPVPNTRTLTINGSAQDLSADRTWNVGTVTTLSVVSANGFAGTVANATTTPAITITTSITGILIGNGTAISAATDADITGKLLTGYVSGAGVISGLDSILGAIQKLNGNIGALVTGVSSVNALTGAVALTGTANRITISAANVFNISASYDALWQPIDATLTALAGLTITANSLVYGTGADAFAVLAQNTTATRKFLMEVSSSAPIWDTVTKTDVGLSAVENTALSTWAGSANITTLGTITTGVWSGTAILATKGGTGQTVYAVGDILYADTTTTLAKLADVAAGSYLRSGGVNTAPVWSTTTLPNSATTGDLIYASASNVYSNLADVATGNVLISGGVATAPSWGQIGTTNLSDYVGWTDYSGTSTIVGWSSFTDKNFYYYTLGKLLFIHFFFAGTSNSTSVTFTIPYNGGTRVSDARSFSSALDNGGAYSTCIPVGTQGGTTVTVYYTAAYAGWTASGNKQVFGAMVIHIA